MGRKIPAMTALLVVLAVVLVAGVAASLSALRRDPPSRPPASHADWSVGSLPSRSYAARS
jgi:invasion protein IalB